MMKKMKIFVTIITLLLAALTAFVVSAGCDKKGGQQGGNEEQTLRFATSKIEMELGQTTQLSPVYPKSYSDVKWISRNEAVATVDDSGNVTAVATGTAIIKLTVSVGKQTQSALCQITVAKKGSEATGRIVVSDTDVRIFAGETYMTQAYLQYGEEKIADTEWSTSDAGVCTVINGAITGVSQGTAIVKASRTYGGITYTADVNVYVAAKQQTIEIDLKNDYIVKGEDVRLRVFLVKDGKATTVDDNKVTYGVDNEEIATIDCNVLTGVEVGEIELTATVETETETLSATARLGVLRYCNVEYMVEGEVVATERVLNSKSAAVNVGKPLLDGYVFKEWTIDGKTFSDGSIVDDDVVVYASWGKVTKGSGEYVVEKTIRKYLDNIGFVHDGSGEQVMDDGSFKVNMQKDGVYNYSIAIPSFDFVSQGVTQFGLAMNYSPWTVTFGGAQLVVTSNNSDGHGVYDFVVYATPDGGAKLTNGNVTAKLTQAQANGNESIVFGFVRPVGSTYAQCVVSPMSLCVYDYKAMLSDKAALLSKMTADSDKNEYFGYYVDYFDSLAVATPYERQHTAVPEGVTHAGRLLSGKFTLVDFSNDKHNVTASKSDATTVYSVNCKPNELEIDPSGVSGLYTVFLPKINYLLYKSVSFTYKTSDSFCGIGFEQDKLLSGGNGVLQGTITIGVKDGVATATLYDDTLGAETTVVLSQDEASGITQMQLLYDAALYRKLTISNFIAEM